MSDMSAYLEDKVNDHANGVATFTPAAQYVALFNGDPFGAGSEVTDTIRAAGRVALGTMGASSGGVSTSSAEVDFGSADAGATVTHTCTYDAASGGNQYYADALASTQVISTGNPVSYPAGDITVTYD